MIKIVMTIGCDTCSEQLTSEVHIDYETDYMRVARECMIKEMNLTKIDRGDGTWGHVCPKCMQDYDKAIQSFWDSKK